MKGIKVIISIFSALFLVHSSYGQNQESSQDRIIKDHKNALKTAGFIFEGNVVKQVRYTSKKGEMWTCSVFQVTKVFKGSITLGTIKVITFQSGGSQKVSDGGPSINKTGRYIIVGNIPDSSKLSQQMVSTDNSVTLGTIGVIMFIDSVMSGKKELQTAHAEWMGGFRRPATVYKSIDDLYSFLQDNGLTIQIQAQPRNTIPADSTKH